jgi:hypothetical protein
MSGGELGALVVVALGLWVLLLRATWRGGGCDARTAPALAH